MRISTMQGRTQGDPENHREEISTSKKQEIGVNQVTVPYMISKLAHSQGDEDLVLSFEGIPDPLGI